MRYVERNALRAGLVTRAEDWRWCSLWQRRHVRDTIPLAECPVPLPENWLEVVNEPMTERELMAIRLAVKRRIESDLILRKT